jgi:hypothetical protein
VSRAPVIIVVLLAVGHVVEMREGRYNKCGGCSLVIVVVGRVATGDADALGR